MMMMMMQNANVDKNILKYAQTLLIINNSVIKHPEIWQ